MATVNDYTPKDEEAVTDCASDNDMDNSMALSARQVARPVITNKRSVVLVVAALFVVGGVIAGAVVYSENKANRQQSEGNLFASPFNATSETAENTSPGNPTGCHNKTKMFWG